MARQYDGQDLDSSLQPYLGRMNVKNEQGGCTTHESQVHEFGMDEGTNNQQKKPSKNVR